MIWRENTGEVTTSNAACNTNARRRAAQFRTHNV